MKDLAKKSSEHKNDFDNLESEILFTAKLFTNF
jgi:hypothetical protein